MAAPVDQDDLDDQIAGLKPNLLGFAWSLTRDAAEAEDLVQETFSRALGARHRFQAGTNLRAWLFTILRNLHLNRRRDAAAHPQVVGFEELVAERAADRRIGDVEQQVVARATLEQVAAAFRTLPPPSGRAGDQWPAPAPAPRPPGAGGAGRRRGGDPRGRRRRRRLACHPRRRF